MHAAYLEIALTSYLLGSIPFGYILVRVFRGQDIRATGSGNIGATNVARSGAPGLAIATLLLDAGKGFLAVMVSRSFDGFEVLYRTSAGHEALYRQQWFAAALAALFAIAGHIFSPWLKFRGGKGVATAAGAFLALAPEAILIVLALFIVLVAVTRYVSFGSIIAVAAFPAVVYLLLERYEPVSASRAVLITISLASLLIIIKHHENIRRLLAGTEHRFSLRPTKGGFAGRAGMKPQ